jgi:3-oxoacyl-(acyl-carrier-protein) synthase
VKPIDDARPHDALCVVDGPTHGLVIANALMNERRDRRRERNLDDDLTDEELLEEEVLLIDEREANRNLFRHVRKVTAFRAWTPMRAPTAFASSDGRNSASARVVTMETSATLSGVPLGVGGSRFPLSIVGVGTASAAGSASDEVRAFYTRAEPSFNSATTARDAFVVGRIAPSAEDRLVSFVGERRGVRAFDRSAQLAAFAASGAIAQAAWRGGAPCGVAVGSSRGATGLLEQHHEAFVRSPQSRLPNRTSPLTTLGNIASAVARELEVARLEADMAADLSMTCSTAAVALLTGVAWLRAGLGSRYLCGGAEAPLTPFTLEQMAAVGVLARGEFAPWPCRGGAASKPNSMVLAEGAAIVALEAGAAPDRTLAHLVGVGSAVERAGSLTAMDSDGAGLQLAMRRALADAGLARVDAVVTHTPGTTLGDAAELAAIRAVFGDELPVLTSNKWLIGHTLGASAALSVAFAIDLLRGMPTPRYPYPVPFAQQAGTRPIRSVLVNSAGFGGICVSLALTASQSGDDRR